MATSSVMPAQPPFERDCSPNEYLYHHLQAVGDAVCMQFVVEGDGAIEPDRFIAAVAAATEAAPGATLRLRGRRLAASGAPVPVRFEPDAVFDGFDFATLPQLRRKLDVAHGPGAEIVVLGRQAPCILFRVFHGVMDGKGAMIWIENVFRALRAEPLVVARATLTDVAFLQPRPAHQTPVTLTPHYSVKADAPQDLGAVEWHRFRLAGRHPSLLAKVAAQLAQTASDAASRFMLPVDLRRHDPDVACTGNLTLPIFLDVARGAAWRDVNGELIAQLMAGAELNRAAADFPAIFWVPPAVLRLALAAGLAGLKLSRRYAVTGILSHLGKLDLTAFSGGGFVARAFCSLPVHVPFAPLALVVVETEGHVDVVFSTQQGFFSRAELAALLPGGAA